MMNGVDSDTIHTYIQDRPLIDVPTRKVELKSGYGTDGGIPFDEEAYNNTEMELTFVTNGKDLIADRQAFVNLMDTRGTYGEFIPYFDPEKVYRVMMGDKLSFENKYYYGNAQASQTTLTIKPYKYLIDSPTKTMSGLSDTMINPTNYVSQPIIKIEGSGDVVISINGIEFKMQNIPEALTINSEIYSAYTEGATGPLKSMNDRIFTREYPLLTPGRNNIEVSGAVTKVVIEPRWRSLV